MIQPWSEEEEEEEETLPSPELDFVSSFLYNLPQLIRCQYVQLDTHSKYLQLRINNPIPYSSTGYHIG